MDFLIANWLFLAVTSFVCVVIAVANQLLMMRAVMKFDGPPSVARFGITAIFMLIGSFTGLAAAGGFIADLLQRR